MMPESKYLHLTVVLSSALVLSACSMPDILKFDTVDDTVAYQNAAESINALSIPPGLSNPAFDQTYALPKAQVSSNSSETVAALAKPDSAPKTPVQERTTNSTGVSGGGFGAALLGQSDVGTAQTVARPKLVMPQVAMIKLKGGEPALAINAPSAEAWKFLAPALGGAGFNVTKQQQAQGIVTATYQGADKPALRKGQSYMILLAENASKQSFIGVAKSNGKPASAAVAQEVLVLVKTAFEQ